MEPYIGEIRLFSWNWAPKDWALCDGTTMQIAQAQALYSLLGIAYGGDARTTFMLPDLRGRTPVGSSTCGTKGGAETVTLSLATMPAHSHRVYATTELATKGLPTDAFPATPDVTTGSAIAIYEANDVSSGAKMTINSLSVDTAGDSGTHNNMQPSTVVNFCIAMVGVYPMRT